MSKNQPSHEQRLIAIEQRLDGLENSLLVAIRDLGITVSQLISLRQAQGHSHGHDHHHEEPQAPQLVFKVFERLTENTMYRIYQDAYDHPINPGKVHIHTRRELGSDQFEVLDVDENLAALLTHEFQHQTGGTVNVAFYVEVYRTSAEPIDDSSFIMDQQAAPAPAEAVAQPVGAARVSPALPKSLQPALQPSAGLPAVDQGVFEHLTPAQQMQQMVQGLTEQVRARTVGDSRPGLPGAGQSR
ncbi:hypothetical protein [Streptomyces sp. CHB9.2]|uniref:hypothetical protein n=1 Tax=Streptomyces sp. CHB9.2 TaxID=2841670 RepID=UPI002094BC3B|nr:hypothetical protein [Streptomyces sp. CHB9.2]MCO6704918.1 hypothetical protein [Streptomyces sp. CHB9.2]